MQQYLIRLRTVARKNFSYGKKSVSKIFSCNFKVNIPLF